MISRDCRLARADGPAPLPTTPNPARSNPWATECARKDAAHAKEDKEKRRERKKKRKKGGGGGEKGDYADSYDQPNLSVVFKICL